VSAHVTRSEAETEALGLSLGAELRPGSVLLLSGPLGAGKTAFVRGLAAGLAADPAEVSSPTFTLIQEYRGRLVLQHVDLYRLSAREAADLGLEELAGGDAVVAVEWPDRWIDAPPGAIHVRFDVTGESARAITIERAAP
jgi:tRNA threonylcarbamoyladenosine biosynthesis protein TsaE